MRVMFDDLVAWLERQRDDEERRLPTQEGPGSV
jgi:hypothetical protein